MRKTNFCTVSFLHQGLGIAFFCKLLIINNDVPRTCVQSVSETFAEKVVQNAVAGMVQR